MIVVILNSMIISYVLTIMIEYIVMEFIIKEKRQYIKYFLLINLITNPAVVLIFNILNICQFENISIVVVILEIVVVLVEGKLYKVMLKENKNKWYINSLILNSISYMLGICISNNYT